MQKDSKSTTTIKLVQDAKKSTLNIVMYILKKTYVINFFEHWPLLKHIMGIALKSLWLARLQHSENGGMGGYRVS